jgi:hypothetical protein
MYKSAARATSRVRVAGPDCVENHSRLVWQAKSHSGRVLMARGRDAAEVAMTTSFGKTPWNAPVWTDEVE